MITNKTVRERTGQDTLESIIRERRLRWFGHIYQMDTNRRARQVMDWTLPHFRRNRGRPRVSWTSTVKKDLDLLGLTWNGESVLPDVLLQHEEGLTSKVRSNYTL